MTGVLLGVVIALAWICVGMLVFREYGNTDYYAVLAAWNVPTISVPVAVIIRSITAVPLWSLSMLSVAFVASVISLIAIARQPFKFDVIG